MLRACLNENDMEYMTYLHQLIVYVGEEQQNQREVDYTHYIRD